MTLTGKIKLARLDLFLKHTGLIKQRTQAKRACDDECVQVNGKPAKASQQIRPGETIIIDTEMHYIEAQVLDIPRRSPAKKQRDRYVRILREEHRDPIEDLSF